MNKKQILLICASLLAVGLCILLFSGKPSTIPRPTSSHPTPYTMKVDGLSTKSGTYSEYYFAPDQEEALHISGSLQVDGASDHAECRIKILLFQIGIEDNIDSFTVDSSGGSLPLSHAFTGLNSNAFYYLRIDNISGTASKSGSLVGTIEIG